MEKRYERKAFVTIPELLLYIFLIALAIISFLPFYIMIINSTRSSSEISSGMYLIPGGSFMANYNQLSELVDVWRCFFNSAVAAFSATLISAYVGALTAYGFAKYRFKGKDSLFVVVIASMIIPPQLAIIGFYDIANKIGILDSLWPLIIPAAANANLVFFVRYYIESAVPDSVIESSRLDGGGELKTFNSIALPMIIPSIATMSIFTFISNWNSFLLPFIVITSKEMKTVPLMITEAKGQYQTELGPQFSAIALSVIPIIIVFMFCSKYIIGGLTAGAVKE